MTIFNKKKVDHSKEYMFFGESLNVARYDKAKFEKFNAFTEEQSSFFWKPDEVDLSKDRYEFNHKLTDHEKHIFISNLKYQTLLDSVQGRSPVQIFLPICSLPELETWLETWSFFECLAEGTEVLTSNGWKDLKDVTVEDQCLVYDLKDESVFFEKPKQVVEYDIDIDMIHYKSGSFEQLVTPNHRMPYFNHNTGESGFKEAKDMEYVDGYTPPINGYDNNFLFFDQPVYDKGTINKTVVPYKGKVRCLETSTGAFAIRYNGVVSITGNTIHARSYTHIIQSMFDNPSEVLDDIMQNEFIMKRAEQVTKYYEDLEDYVYNKEDISISEAKLRLLKCMMSVYCLEAVRFYVSFACSFAFNERELMEGNSKIIQLINRDEHVHKGSTHFILTRWSKGLDDPEMTKLFNDNKQELISIMKETIDQEKAWSDYLFSNGSMLGLNSNILNQYLEYLGNTCLDYLGLEEQYDQKSNPIPWIDKYLKSDNVQLAPQEAELKSYLVDSVDNTVSNKFISKLSLD